MRVARRAAISAVVLACLTAEARADLELIATGTFDTGTTVGATTLAAPASYSLDAIFDPTSGVPVDSEISVFRVKSATIDVLGIGTMALEPSAGTYVFFAVIPGSGGVPTLYEAGVSDITNAHGFGTSFQTSSDPAFSAAAPTPAVFSDYYLTGLDQFSFPLVGGGTLAYPGVDLYSEGATAEIVAVGVPEPSALVLMGMGGGLVGVSRLRRRGR
jgi:hypothetical protein